MTSSRLPSIHADASAIILGAVAGTTLSQEETEFFRQNPLAGVTLFRWNISESWDGLRSLIRSLRATQPGESACPLLVAVDQEGGRVARLKGDFPNQGPAMNLVEGKTDPISLALIESYAAQIATSLKDLGFNINFAPVCDILTEPKNVGIGDRAFGTDVETVCARADAFLRGLQSVPGVFGCLKHFPGQGDAGADTHTHTAIVDLPRSQLDKRELVPFRALLPKTHMVMIAHCIYPQLAPMEASRSPQIIGGILRGEMSFEGLVLSDDLNMQAFPQEPSAWQSALVEGLMAGTDLFLVCKHLERMKMAIAGFSAAAEKSDSVRHRLRDAAARVTAFRKSLLTTAA